MLGLYNTNELREHKINYHDSFQMRVQYLRFLYSRLETNIGVF